MKRRCRERDREQKRVEQLKMERKAAKEDGKRESSAALLEVG